MNQPLELEFQLFLEADDISQTRILKTVSFVKNLFCNCENTYLKATHVEDDSDLEDFSLRIFAGYKVKEECCCNRADAEVFVQDMIEFLDALAQAQSYAQMDGKLFITLGDQKEEYQFISEEGQDYCEVSRG